MQEVAPPVARVGRPRDQRIDDAVLVATRELLVELGYTRLSYERIAQRAGATRPAMYRRWPSKAHLVHDAVFAADDDELVPSTGSFEDDLRTLIDRTFDAMSRPEARVALPGLLSDLDDPDRRHHVMDGLQGQLRSRLAARVDQAIRDGELDPSADAGLLLDAVVGTLFQRIVARRQLDPTITEGLAELLLHGLQRPRRSP